MYDNLISYNVYLECATGKVWVEQSKSCEEDCSSKGAGYIFKKDVGKCCLAMTC